MLRFVHQYWRPKRAKYSWRRILFQGSVCSSTRVVQDYGLYARSERRCSGTRAKTSRLQTKTPGCPGSIHSNEATGGGEKPLTLKFCVRAGASLLGILLVVGCKTVRDAEFVGTCLGGFCVEPPRFLERDLVAKYGPGWVPDEGLHCYSVVEKNLEVRFDSYPAEDYRVLSVLVSGARICSQAKPSNELFPRFTTSEGLGIGDSRERVIRLYGQPAEELCRERGDEILDPFGLEPITDDIGDTILRYRPDNADGIPMLEVYLRRGVVSSLFVSAFP
jgi:hypothetical protein